MFIEKCACLCEILCMCVCMCVCAVERKKAKQDVVTSLKTFSRKLVYVNCLSQVLFCHCLLADNL